MFPLRFHITLCLLQFHFSYSSANFFFKGIIGDFLTTFDFPVSFCNSNLACIAFCVVFFFLALFVEYSWVIKFLFIYEGAIIIRQWGSGDDDASGV